MNKGVAFMTALILVMAVEGLAQSNPTPTPSGYVDLLQTEVQGMSEELVQTYRTGGGGGVALPAN